MQTTILLSKSEKGLHGLKSRISPCYKAFQQNLHLTEQNSLGNKKASPEEEKKINQPLPNKSHKKGRGGHLAILISINDLLNVVLVFDRERDTSIFSHQPKV